MLKIILAFLITIVLTMMLMYYKLALVALILLSVFLVFARFSLIKKIYLITFMTIAIPSSSSADKFFGTGSLGFTAFHVLELLYAIIIVHFLFNVFSGKKKIIISREYLYLFIFYIIVIISIVRGSETTLKNSLFSSKELFYYTISIIVFNEFTFSKHISGFLKSVSLGLFTYMLILLSIYFIPSNLLKMFISQDAWGETRIAFRNHEYFTFLLPFAFCFLITKQKQSIKIINFAILTFGILFLALGQGRVNFACAVITLLMILILVLFKHVKMEINVIRLLTVSLSLLLLLTIFVSSILFYRGENGLVLDTKARIISISSLKDDSSVRFREKQSVKDMEEINKYYWLGQGMKGFHRDFYLGKFSNIFWDNTNTIMIRKIGIVGYAPLLLFLFFIIKKIFYCYRYSSDKLYILIAASLLSLLPSQVLKLFTVPYLAQYKIILFYGIIIGIVQVMERNMKMEKTYI